MLAEYVGSTFKEEPERHQWDRGGDQQDIYATRATSCFPNPIEIHVATLVITELEGCRR